MRYYVEKSFDDFKPWSGAVETFQRIITEGKADEADRYFEELAPADGWSETAINDALWFDSDTIYKALGMKPDDTTTHDADEIGEKWQEENARYNFKLLRLEFDADEVRAVYFDDDDETRAEEVETLTAEDVAGLFGDDACEIDFAAHTVETWDE